MVKIIEKLIQTAEAEIGYLEKASNSQLEDKTANAGSNNYTKYAAWYDGGSLQGQPWCAMFISWCAHQAGIPAGILYRHAYCPYGATWFKNNGRWHARGSYVPQRGDLIYFTNDGSLPSHVGIVYASDNSKVYTIEGNTTEGSTMVANGGCVAKKSYSLNYSQILGYGNPAYEKEEENVTQEQFNLMMQVYISNLQAQTVSDWAKKTWEIAAAAGIFDGTMPKSPLTREQAAVVLSRLGLIGTDLLQQQKI